MVKWIREGFKSLLGAAFVFLTIACGVAGGALAYIMLGEEWAFLGVIFGLFVGFLLNILLFGLVATVVDMADNTEKILRLLRQGNSLDGRHGSDPLMTEPVENDTCRYTYGLNTEFVRADEADKYRMLYEQGIISEEEYRAAEDRINNTGAQNDQNI